MNEYYECKNEIDRSCFCRGSELPYADLIQIVSDLCAGLVGGEDDG